MLGLHFPNPKPQPNVQLEALYGELLLAKQAGDIMTAELKQAAINDLLDRWKELHA